MASKHAYRPDIDGLRAVAVLAVAAFHGFPAAVPGGFIGVDVFFVISGFLITGILLGQAGEPAQRIRVFYVRRIRRIFPALIVVLAAALAFGTMVLFADELRRLGKLAVASAAFVPNIALWLDGGYFDTAADSKPLVHLWSLGIEEQFYLAWPALLMLGRGGRRLAMLTGLLAIASFGSGMHLIHSDAFAAFYWPQGRAWELLAGAGLAQALHGRAAAEPPPWLRESLAVIGTALIVAGCFALNRKLAFPGALALVPVAGAAGIIAAGPRALVNRVFLAWRPMVAIGLVSYPFYLWHWPLLSFARIVAGGTPSAAIRAACLAASLLLAIATYLWVEKPLRSRERRGTAAILTAAMALVFAAAAWLFLSHGWPGRALNRPFDGPVSRPYGRSVPLDRACLEALHAVPGPKEFCKTDSPAPKFLFIGDSHAMSLYSAVTAGTYKLRAALVAGHGCKLYLGLVNSPEVHGSFESQCEGIAEDALRIAAANPSIGTVIIAQRAPEMSRPSPFLQAGRRLTHAEAFRIGERRMLDSLRALGKRLIFVEDTPVFGFPPNDCEARPPFPAPRDCRLPRAAFLASRAALDAAVGDLRQDIPGLLVMDPIDGFCDSAFCSMRRDGRWLYEDENHLNPTGSLHMLKLMEKAGFLEPTLD